MCTYVSLIPRLHTWYGNEAKLICALYTMEVGVAYSFVLYKMPQSLGDKFLTKLQQVFLESHRSHRVSMDFSNVFR